MNIINVTLRENTTVLTYMYQVIIVKNSIMDIYGA